MGKSDDLRKNAENCIELADAADTVQKKYVTCEWPNHGIVWQIRNLG